MDTSTKVARLGVLLATALAMTEVAPAAAEQHEPDPSAAVAAMHPLRVHASSLDDLAARAGVIIVGRVASQGATTFIQPTASEARPAPFAPEPAVVKRGPDGSPIVDDGKALPSETDAERDGVIIHDLGVFPPGIPITRFDIEVTRVLRGPVRSGSRLPLVQVGGSVELPSLEDGAAPRSMVVQDEDDALLSPSPRLLLLFLVQRADGTYATVNGPEGRFALDANGRLDPADAGSGVAQSLRGQTLDVLSAQLR